MDPITAIGLLASISNLICASGDALQLLRSFKDGDKELAGLVSHVALFEENLKGFHRVFASNRHAISAETLTQAVEESSRQLEDLKMRLGQIQKAENWTVRRMRWLQHKTSLERIDAWIKGQCALLHGLVSVAQMEMIMAMCGRDPRFLDLCSSVATEMETSAKLDNMEADAPCIPQLEMPEDAPSLYQQPSGESQPPSLGVKSVQPEGDKALLTPEGYRSRSSISPQPSDARRASVASTASSHASSPGDSVFSAASITTSISAPDTDPEGCPTRPSPVPVPVNSLVIRRACRFNCYCRCHSQSTVVPRDVLSKFNAKIFRPDKAAKTECDEPDCEGAASSTRKIPTEVFHRAFSRLLTLQSARPAYPLNTYRMVPEGSNALRYVKHGNLDRLKAAMIMREATPWDTAPDGWSLLHTAVYARQLPTVKYLCELGVDKEAADLGIRKPMDLAILKSFTADASETEHQIVRALGKPDGYLDDFDFTPMHIAVLGLYDPTDSERPSLEQLIEFIDTANNAPIGTNWSWWKTKFQKRSPLFGSIIEQFRASADEGAHARKVIHNLLDQKDRKFHWTPLHWAAATNRADKMRVLVQHGADPFIQSNLNASIIHAAVESNALQSLEYALSLSRMSPTRLNIDQANIWGESPLMMAAQGSLVDCVRLLLDAGADYNVRQENGQVALHYAGLSTSGNARKETAALLCAGKGAHINTQDEDGRSPLFEFLDDCVCTEHLLQSGAQVDVMDNNGSTVFHHICIEDEVMTLQVLLTSAGSANLLTTKNQKGNTALLEALQHGSIDCAMIMLDLNNAGYTSSGEGWTPVHYAARLGDVGLLEKVVRHPDFRKGVRTEDGKTAQVVAMEAGTWCGRVKDILREYNSMT